MSRRSQYGESLPNPTVRYYEWKSNDKTFSYYDKDKKENVAVFPLKIALLTERSTVRGWHDETESSIWANEVKNPAKERFSVQSSKPAKGGNTLIATGIYQEIKGKLEGGHFERVIYGYEEGVGIVKIYLKGSSLGAYSNFRKETGNKCFDKFIVVDEFVDGKKGSIKFTFPKFKLDGEFNSELDVKIDEAFQTVEEYLDSKGKSKEEVNNDYVPEEHDSMTPPPQQSAMEEISSDDDLPF
jgi:hypothetical protein